MARPARDGDTHLLMAAITEASCRAMAIQAGSVEAHAKAASVVRMMEAYPLPYHLLSPLSEQRRMFAPHLRRWLDTLLSANRH